VVRVVVPVHAQQCFDADASGDVIAAQPAVIGEAGKGKIAGSVVTEHRFWREADLQRHRD